MKPSSPSSAPRLLLVRKLSRVSPDWALWKNVDRTLAGFGDIDSLASKSSWPVISSAFEDWAFSSGFIAVASCAHIPGVLRLVAVSPIEATLSELDVCDEFYWRGSRLFSATQVAPLMIQDTRGFRCLRPGAQGLFLLLANVVQRGGRQDRKGIKDKQVIRLLESDPEGALRAAQTLGFAGKATMRLAAALQDQEWKRGTAMWLEAYALAAALLSPRGLAARVVFRLGSFRPCPVSEAVRGRRETPRDIQGWLQRVAESHSVVRTSSP